MTQTVFSDDFTASRHDGIYDRCSAAQAVKDGSVSTLDSISPAVCATLSPEADDNPVLHVNSPSLEGSRSAGNGNLFS